MLIHNGQRFEDREPESVANHSGGNTNRRLETFAPRERNPSKVTRKLVKNTNKQYYSKPKFTCHCNELVIAQISLFGLARLKDQSVANKHCGRNSDSLTRRLCVRVFDPVPGGVAKTPFSQGSLALSKISPISAIDQPRLSRQAHHHFIERESC